MSIMNKFVWWLITQSSSANQTISIHKRFHKKSLGKIFGHYFYYNVISLFLQSFEIQFINF